MVKYKAIAKFKQMSFETAVRNPERYKKILTSLHPFVNQVLNDKKLLEIVTTLYINGIVSSNNVDVNGNFSMKSIKEKVIDVNSTRKADGGYPAGYQSRFWTYMRTLSELGFVYAQYNEPLKFSKIALMLINNKLDEQESFSIQAMKYNRRSPYRNVSNDFNYFRFILVVLLHLRKEKKALSFEQFIISTFSMYGNTEQFLNTIKRNKFRSFIDTYNFVKKKYKATNRIRTVTKDYPDVIRRILIISGFISIRYTSKKFIQINENKVDYIKELLTTSIELSEIEKSDPIKYFNKLNRNDDVLLKIVKKYRKVDKLDAIEYTNTIFKIIKTYRISQKVICECIERIDTKKAALIPEFQEIPEPLKLEFFIAILIALKYGKIFTIRPNYKADHLGKPYSHAPGEIGDIEVFSDDLYWLIEVTLIRNKTQQLNNETTSVIRHLISGKNLKFFETKYLSFVAPVIHADTKEYFDYSSILHKTSTLNIYLKTYSIDEFVVETQKMENLQDMKKYTLKVYEMFRKNLY